MTMKTDDFMYIVETKKSFDDAVVSVLKAVDKFNWTLFNIYDVKERLAAKGFEQSSLKIIEICSVKHANKLLNKNRLISLCMPCKIYVLEENEKVKIVGMKPTMITNFFPEIKQEEVEEIEKDIKDIIDSAK